MSLPITVIDAFTSEAFKGNPAAVCLLDGKMDDRWLRQVAAEMNLSETAFLLRREDESYGLRWFTPAAEVDLCGHATLAAAHFLWETGALAPDREARFHTRSGLLSATRSGTSITLDFPAEPVSLVMAPEELIQALGLIPRCVGRNRMDYLVEVDSEQTVRSLKPDFALLARLEARGVIVTSRADAPGGESRYDFISRAFFPAVGINEDPVTGSAHCALAPYWQRRLRKDEMLAYQASARGGELTVQVSGDRVKLIGAAVTVLRGRLHV